MQYASFSLVIRFIPQQKVVCGGLVWYAGRVGASDAYFNTYSRHAVVAVAEVSEAILEVYGRWCIGLTALFPALVSKCNCAVLTPPVEPTVAIFSPFFTSCPFATKIRSL